MSTIRKITYRVGLFDPVNLVTKEKIDEALYEFAGVITQANHGQVLEGLLDKSHIVELVLSGLGEEIPLQDWILNGFPSSAQHFEETFSCNLLIKLSDFFLFHSSGEAFDREHHQTIKLAPEILQSLLAWTVLGNVKPSSCVHTKFVSKKTQWAKTSQKEIKKAQRATHRPGVNEAPLLFANMPVPQTSSDAITSIESFLERLKEILKVYLIKIRTEKFCTIIKESFIPQERPAELHINTVSRAVVDEPLPPAPTTVTTTAVAFPMIQPMKSALYFDSPEGFGKWIILVSSSAHQDLRQHRRKAKASFDIIVKKMKELSNGHFSFDNQKRLSGPGTEVPIYEAKLSGDLRLVYQIDCIPGYDIETETQVLRVYGIYTHAQMDKRLWDSVSSGRSRRGGEYRSRCLQRKKQDGDVFLPICFSSSEGVEEESSPTIPDLPLDDNNQLHKILTLEKYVTLSKEFLDSIEDNRDAMFPFEVSKYERKIVEHPSSCYVLGRSGTGKTTTMLYKMLRIERDYQRNSEYSAKPRQVFVTQSRVLAAKVEDLFASYLESLAIASRGGTKHTQVGTDGTDTEEGSPEEDDGIDWRSDLPQRFSELDDKHFPLFLTVDRLYGMIEADIEASEKEVKPDFNSFEIGSPASRQPIATVKGRLITYDRFLGEYWPHLTQSLKKNFNATLVFSEFMGVIQGSQRTVTSPNGCLDRKTYEELSARQQPTFAEHRSAIYGLFESYRRLKNEKRDYDSPDRTHTIIRAITQRQGILGQTFDYIYVDETQDNLLVDSLVLRLLSRNTDGLFWAGDTAQTISAGSSFRFKDLTSFLFLFEEQRRLRNSLPSSLPAKSKKPVKPKQFHLAVNYRSHSGIVNCAHSVIELISEHWPYSIDSLPRERGNTIGAKPIFYQDIYPGFIHEGHFLSKNKDRAEKIELGADQCILVRDEAAKQRLEEEIGKIGIVITIYDSKGLEFNDVFLYNFFHDSAVEVSQWRLVLNSISTEDPTLESAPRFDSTRHAAICAELKSLYVAITRARNNLRIADESIKGEPMRALWTNRGQIRNCHPGDDLSDFAVPSSKDEWIKRALELSRNHKYALARDSYEKAERPQEAAVENARYLQQLAVRTPFDARNRKREAAFKLAAETFLSCAESATKSHIKKSCYRSSAECFEEACEDLSAAKVYLLVEDFSKASLLFRKLGRFDDVHSILVHHADKVANVESLRDIVRLYYVNKKEFSKTHQLFETLDEEIEYLEDRNLDMAQVDLYLMHGRNTEAADLHLTEGRVLEAVDVFIEDAKFGGNASRQAAGYILQGLWWNLSVGTLTTAENTQVKELLNRFGVLDKGSIEAPDLLEFDMFQAIVSNDFDNLAPLAKSLLDAGNPDAAFLCLDYYYNIIPSLETMHIMEIAASLELFSEYIHMFHDLAFSLDPISDPRVLKIFGITKADNDYVMLSNNILSRSTSFTTSHVTESSSCHFSKNDLVSIYRSCIQDRLLDRVTRENDSCRRSSALYPCLRHLIYLHSGGCNDLACRQAHISPNTVWRQNWLFVHLLQISIYDSISNKQFKKQMRSERRFWIRKLYEVFNPPHYLLGSLYDTHCDIVDAKTKWAVVNDWARTISFELEYQWQDTSFLTTVLQAADLAFTLNQTEASAFMFRSQFVSSPDTPALFLTNNSQNILQALLVSMNGKDPSSLLMGISFIARVVDFAIPVDINVFMSFIENICSSFIICNQFRWKQNLHKVTLPRGWIIRALKQFDPVKAIQQDTRGRFWSLLRPLRAVIEGIYYRHAEHFLFGDDMRRLSFQPPAVRNVFISRVFRVLGLLGTNIRVEDFRVAVHACLTSLRPFPPHPRIYSSYVNADNFGGIVAATRRSLQGSAFDEMVQLNHSAHVQHPLYKLEGLHRIVYTQQEDILRILDANSNEISPALDNRTSSLGIENLNVKDVGPTSETHELEGEVRTEEDGILDGNASESADDLDSDVQDREDIPEIKIPEDLQVGYSDREVAATFVIQKLARNILSKQRLSKGSGLDSTVYKWSSLCLQLAPPIVMGSQRLRRYKLRYLGFVPAILGCLDEVNGLVMVKKGELKRRFRDGTLHHQEIDEISRNMTRITFILKAIKKLQEVLRPQSDLHARHDVDDLKKHVQSGLDLLSDLQLPLQLPNEIREELHMIYRGMLQEARPSSPTKKMAKRPTLNVDQYTASSVACDWDDEWLDL